MLDIKEHIHNDVASVFRIKVNDTPNPTTQRSLAQTVDSFQRFIGIASVHFDDFNEELLGEWISWLFCQGYSFNTVNYYVNRLSSLYGKVVKDDGIADNGAFPRIKSKLANTSLQSIEINSDAECFRKLCNLIHIDCLNNALHQLAKDIVLFSVYNGGMSFEAIAKFRKNDYVGDDPAIVDIIQRYSKPKNKYLFPLNQSARTANQLNNAISALFSTALRMVGISLSTYNSSVPVCLWTVAATRCGISAMDISSCIGPVDFINPLFSFVDRKDISHERRTEIHRRVSQILTKKTEYWYAMQFRPHVTYEMVESRIKNSGIRFKDLFYPMEEIYRRIDKKMVRRSRSIVNGLLFFKSKLTDVPEIFSHIGDLAWCYRQTRDTRSPYAVISDRDIDRFRNTIGQFSEGMEIYEEGTVHIGAGDKVEIIGGEFNGYPATLEKVIKETTENREILKRIIFRLRLIGNNKIEWVVNVDSRLVSKISNEKFDTLQQNLYVDSNHAV